MAFREDARQGNTTARKRLGLPDALGSCHTAVVGNYVVEGHVPARDIQRLLRERPKAMGLACPACPWAHPAWTGPNTAAARTATTCCWSPLTAAPAFTSATTVERKHHEQAHHCRADCPVVHARPGPGARPRGPLAEVRKVRRVDKDSKKVTLKHGPIKNLDMPGMTMVFQVRDPALLDKIAAGDKIRFTAEQQQGAYVVTFAAALLSSRWTDHAFSPPIGLRHCCLRI
jgi:Cu/Ag efflux protein CusF